MSTTIAPGKGSTHKVDQAQEGKRAATKPKLWATVSLHPAQYSFVDFDMVLCKGTGRDNGSIASVANASKIQPQDIDVFDVEFEAEPGQYSLYAVRRAGGDQGEKPQYSDTQWQGAFEIFSGQDLKTDTGKVDAGDAFINPTLIGGDRTADKRVEQQKELEKLGEFELSKYLKVTITGAPLVGRASAGRAATDQAGALFSKASTELALDTAVLKEKLKQVAKILELQDGFDLDRTLIRFGDVAYIGGKFKCTVVLTCNEAALILDGVLDAAKLFNEQVAPRVQKLSSQELKVAIDAKTGVVGGSYRDDLIKVEYEIGRLLNGMDGAWFLPDRVQIAGVRAEISDHSGVSPHKPGIKPAETDKSVLRHILDPMFESVMALTGAKDKLKDLPISLSYFAFDAVRRRVRMVVSVDYKDAKSRPRHVNFLLAFSIEGLVKALYDVVAKLVGEASTKAKAFLDKIKDSIQFADGAVYFEVEEGVRLKYHLDRQYPALNLWALLPDRVQYYKEDAGKKVLIADARKASRSTGAKVAFDIEQLPTFLKSPLKQVARVAGLPFNPADFVLLWVEPKADTLPRIVAPRDKKDDKGQWQLPVILQIAHKSAEVKIAYELRTRINLKKALEYVEKFFKDGDELPPTNDDFSKEGLEWRLKALAAWAKKGLHKAEEKVGIKEIKIDYDKALLQLIFDREKKEEPKKEEKPAEKDDTGPIEADYEVDAETGDIILKVTGVGEPEPTGLHYEALADAITVANEAYIRMCSSGVPADKLPPVSVAAFNKLRDVVREALAPFIATDEGAKKVRSFDELQALETKVVQAIWKLREDDNTVDDMIFTAAAMKVGDAGRKIREPEDVKREKEELEKEPAADAVGDRTLESVLEDVQAAAEQSGKMANAACPDTVASYAFGDIGKILTQAAVAPLAALRENKDALQKPITPAQRKTLREQIAKSLDDKFGPEVTRKLATGAVAACQRALMVAQDVSQAAFAPDSAGKTAMEKFRGKADNIVDAIRQLSVSSTLKTPDDARRGLKAEMDKALLSLKEMKPAHTETIAVFEHECGKILSATSGKELPYEADSRADSYFIWLNGSLAGTKKNTLSKLEAVRFLDPKDVPETRPSTAIEKSKVAETFWVGFRLDKLIERLLDGVEWHDFIPDIVHLNENVYGDTVPVALEAERLVVADLGQHKTVSTVDIDLLPPILSEAVKRVVSSLGYDPGAVDEFEKMQLDRVILDIVEARVVTGKGKKKKKKDKAVLKKLGISGPALLVRGEIYSKSAAIRAREMAAARDGEAASGKDGAKGTPLAAADLDKGARLQKLAFSLAFELKPAEAAVRDLLVRIGRYLYVQLSKLREAADKSDSRLARATQAAGNFTQRVVNWTDARLRELREAGWSLSVDFKPDYDKNLYPLSITVTKTDPKNKEAEAQHQACIKYELTDLFKGITWKSLEALEAEFSGSFARGTLKYAVQSQSAAKLDKALAEKAAKASKKATEKSAEAAEKKEGDLVLQMSLLPPGLVTQMNGLLKQHLHSDLIDLTGTEIRSASVDWVAPALIKLDGRIDVAVNTAKVAVTTTISFDVGEFLLPGINKFFNELTRKPEVKDLIAQLKLLAKSGFDEEGGAAFLSYLIDKALDKVHNREGVEKLVHPDHEHAGVWLVTRESADPKAERKVVKYLGIDVDRRDGALFFSVYGEVGQKFSYCVSFDLRDASKGLKELFTPDDYFIEYADTESRFALNLRYQPRQKAIDSKVAWDWRSEQPVRLQPFLDKMASLPLPGVLQDNVGAALATVADAGKDISFTFAADVAFQEKVGADSKVEKVAAPDALAQVVDFIPNVDMRVRLGVQIQGGSGSFGVLVLEMHLSLTDLLVKLLRSVWETLKNNPTKILDLLAPVLRTASASGGKIGLLLEKSPFKMKLPAIQIDFGRELRIGISEPLILEVGWDLSKKTMAYIPSSYTIGYSFENGAIVPRIKYTYRSFGDYPALAFNANVLSHEAQVAIAPPAGDRTAWEAPWRLWTQGALTALNKGMTDSQGKPDPLPDYPVLIGHVSDLPDFFRQYVLDPMKNLVGFDLRLFVMVAGGGIKEKEPLTVWVGIGLLMVETGRIHVIALRIDADVLKLAIWIVTKVAPKLLAPVPVVGQLITAAVYGWEFYNWAQKNNVLPMIGQAMEKLGPAILEWGQQSYDALQRKLDDLVYAGYVKAAAFAEDAGAWWNGAAAQHELQMDRARSNALDAWFEQYKARNEQVMRMFVASAGLRFLNGIEFALVTRYRVMSTAQNKVLTEDLKSAKRADELRAAQDPKRVQQDIEEAFRKGQIAPAEFDFYRLLLMPKGGMDPNQLAAAKQGLMMDGSVSRLRRLLFADLIQREYDYCVKSLYRAGLTPELAGEIGEEYKKMKADRTAAEDRMKKAKEAYQAKRAEAAAWKPGSATPAPDVSGVERAFNDADVKFQGLDFEMRRAEFWINNQVKTEHWFTGISLPDGSGVSLSLSARKEGGQKQPAQPGPLTALAAMETENMRRRGFLVARLKKAGLVGKIVPEWEYRLLLLSFGAMDKDDNVKALAAQEPVASGPQAAALYAKDGAEIAGLIEADASSKFAPGKIRWIYLSMLATSGVQKAQTLLDTHLAAWVKEPPPKPLPGSRFPEEALKSLAALRAEDAARFGRATGTDRIRRLRVWLQWILETQEEKTRADEEAWQKTWADYQKKLIDWAHEKKGAKPEEALPPVKLRGQRLLFEMYRRMAVREWFASSRAAGGKAAVTDTEYRSLFLGYGLWSMNMILRELKEIDKLKTEDADLYQRLGYMAKLLLARPILKRYGADDARQMFGAYTESEIRALPLETLRLVVLKLIEGEESADDRRKMVTILEWTARHDRTKFNALIGWFADQNLLVGGKDYNAGGSGAAIALKATEGVFLDLGDEMREKFVQLMVAHGDTPTLATLLDQLLIGYRVYQNTFPSTDAVEGYGGVMIARKPDANKEARINSGLKSLVDKLLKEQVDEQPRLRQLFPELKGGQSDTSGMSTVVRFGPSADLGLAADVAGGAGGLAIATGKGERFYDTLKGLRLLEADAVKGYAASGSSVALDWSFKGQPGTRMLLGDLLQWMSEEYPEALRVELDFINLAYRYVQASGQWVPTTWFFQRQNYTDTGASVETWASRPFEVGTVEKQQKIVDALRPWQGGLLVVPPGDFPGELGKKFVKSSRKSSDFHVLVPMHDGTGREAGRNPTDLALDRYVAAVERQSSISPTLQPVLALGKARELVLRGPPSRDSELSLKTPQDPGFVSTGNLWSRWADNKDQSYLYFNNFVSRLISSYERADFFFQQKKGGEKAEDLRFFFIAEFKEPLRAYHWIDMDLQLTFLATAGNNWADLKVEAKAQPGATYDTIGTTDLIVSYDRGGRWNWLRDYTAGGGRLYIKDLIPSEAAKNLISTSPIAKLPPRWICIPLTQQMFQEAFGYKILENTSGDFSIRYKFALSYRDARGNRYSAETLPNVAPVFHS